MSEINYNQAAHERDHSFSNENLNLNTSVDGGKLDQSVILSNAPTKKAQL